MLICCLICASVPSCAPAATNDFESIFKRVNAEHKTRLERVKELDKDALVDFLEESCAKVGKDRMLVGELIDHAILKLGKTYSDELSAEDVARILTLLTDPHRAPPNDPDFDRHLARLLAKNVPHGRVALKGLLGSGDVDSAVRAAFGLCSERGDAEVDPRALATLFEHQEHSLSTSYLWNHRHPELRDPLRDIIRDRTISANRRGRAASIFVCQASEDDIPFLRELLRSSDAGLRRAAVDGVRRQLGAKALPDLRPLADDPNDNVRGLVYSELARHADASDLPLLTKGLTDESVKVRGCSVSGLERLTDPASLPALVNFLRDDTNTVGIRTRAGKVIEGITGDNFGFRTDYATCGTTSAGPLIRLGKFLGGKEGQRLIDAGTRLLSESNAASTKRRAEIDQVNTQAIHRLLIWWDSDRRPENNEP